MRFLRSLFFRPSKKSPSHSEDPSSGQGEQTSHGGNPGNTPSGQTEQTASTPDTYLLEQELRATNIMVSNLPGFIYRCDLDADRTMNYLSNGFETITGYLCEDVLNNKKRSFGQLIHPDHREKVKNGWTGALKCPNPFSLEYPIIHKNGSVRWVWERGQAVRDHDGHPRYMKGFITDISDRKATELSMKKLVYAAEDFLQMAAEKMDYQAIADTFREISGARFAALNVYDKSGKHYTTMAVSGMGEQVKKISSLLGFSIEGKQWKHDPVRAKKIEKTTLTRFRNMEELAGQGLPGFAVRAIDNMGGLGEMCILKIMQGERMVGDFFFVMPKGDNYIDDDVVNIFSRQTGLLLTRKQAEEELREAKNMAETANHAKSEFLASMSHEIRTPLTAILGFSEILEEKFTDGENRKMTHSITAASQQLLALINDILDLSKIEAGKMPIYPHPTNMERMLEETRSLFAEKAHEKGLAFELEVSEKLPENLILDEVRIKQILFNLLSNSVKFTSKGEVRIEIGFEQDADNNGLLTLTVEDTGEGIDKDKLEYIFEEFSQLTPHIVKKQQGTGLGLAIVHRLTKKMGGTITVDSTKGKGSRFVIRFPGLSVPDESSPQPRSADKPTKLSFKGARVMVVDDVPSNLEVAAVLLQSLGVEAITVSSGREALDQIDQENPQLILLDTRMPDMTGDEVIREIRNNSRWDHIPVVSYSATRPGDTDMHAASLYDNHLLKPLTGKKLSGILKEHLGNAPQTPIPQREKEKTDPFTEPGPFTEEGQQKLSEVLKIVEEEFLPRWQNLKDQLVLFKIEAFAGDLRQLARKHGLSGLERYAHELGNYVDTLDLEAIEKHIHAFPEWVDNLKSHLNKDK